MAKANQASPQPKRSKVKKPKRLAEKKVKKRETPSNDETSPVKEVPVNYCYQIRYNEIHLIHGFIKQFAESSDPHVLCITGRPGSGKTQTVRALLSSVQDGSLSVLRNVDIEDLSVYRDAVPCFIQAFSLNLRQSNVIGSAEFQIATTIIEACLLESRERSAFLKSFQQQTEQSDSLLDCVPMLAQVIPHTFLLGIDEIDRFFDVKLAIKTQNRTGRTGRSTRRRLTPIHFIAELAREALHTHHSRLVLMAISNEEDWSAT
eukprot:Blabericola_migrator_1__1889@NODE_1513_length_4373_cov_130_645146_g994_i0_p4_GENE_NODE_1513_length_4373_cov_130_645146_g994_i0NODE_1513_length_4373_cov_130_645146_g994_i0_p4_ORF_typecomplete_len261_score55_27AAA_22/PF13401_6/1_7e06AAA_16/PF13191_6/9_6e06AAA_30/PF13604_6/4_4e05Rad17/PF03215_15/0_00011ATPase_2/PF01637_18/0_0004DUF815/PF05673_13/0_0011DUF815/PF05673_13/1_1e03AAA/PF00004_29/0_001ABC_tran/PF00005_27/0_00064AAA_5/PF07728_14/0_002AAA_19/PF13245_6/0_0022NACHT/PF05729_12/0_002AAA_14/PF13